MSGDLWQLTATEQARGFRTGQWSAEELVRSVLDRIDDTNPALNAVCTLNENAIAEARETDRARRAGGANGLLSGVPFTVKDLIPTAGIRTTLGSVAHRNWIPLDDEISVGRLRKTGGVLVGKTNTRELGYGVVTDNELFGPTRNPWDTRMTAAGSSGGAAAAIAAGMGSIALGSDGGGSLRVPASVCGVFALKPTFGVVPLYPSCRAPQRAGLDAWETLECIGPITRSAGDASLVLQVIAGFDRRDRHAAGPGSVRFRRPDASRARRLRVLFSPDLAGAEVAPDVAGQVQTAVAELAHGLEWDLMVESPRLPPLAELRETFLTTVAMDTDQTALRKLAETHPVSPDIRELVDRKWTTEEFDRARVERRRIQDILQSFSASADVVLTPTTATTAFPIGLRFPRGEGCAIQDGRHWSPFAFLANLTGQPAASIPAGLTSAGLPVGLQAIGQRFDDMRLLDIAEAAEELGRAGTLMSPLPRSAVSEQLTQRAPHRQF